MAVAVILEFEGATPEQYDQVIQKMGFTPGGSGEPGSLFHWIAKTPAGIRVIDVWKTQAQFEKFAGEKIGPITQEVGMSRPAITFSDVHNYLTAGT